MSDTVIIDGDIVNFLPNFGQAIVVPVPGTITGSGKCNISGKPTCIDGDEKSVEVQGCMYMTSVYSIPGSGTIKIDTLASDQLATKTKSNGKALILKGGKFNAVFEVLAPAMQPPPGPSAPIPDSTKKYSGSGMFISTNIKLIGT